MNLYDQCFMVIVKANNLRELKIPLRIDKSSPDNHDNMNLSNPIGQVTCLILQLYTMEFGSPPLYVEVNRVSRTMDRELLPMLGPYIRALEIILQNVEQNKKDMI